MCRMMGGAVAQRTASANHTHDVWPSVNPPQHTPRTPTRHRHGSRTEGTRNLARFGTTGAGADTGASRLRDEERAGTSGAEAVEREEREAATLVCRRCEHGTRNTPTPETQHNRHKAKQTAHTEPTPREGTAPCAFSSVLPQLPRRPQCTRS